MKSRRESSTRETPSLPRIPLYLLSPSLISQGAVAVDDVRREEEKV